MTVPARSVYGMIGTFISEDPVSIDEFTFGIVVSSWGSGIINFVDPCIVRFTTDVFHFGKTPFSFNMVGSGNDVVGTMARP